METQRPETMDEKDVIELLLRQHVEIRRLINEVGDAPADQRAEAFDRLRRFLAVHETAEEEIVHPIARRQGENLEQIVDTRLQEENEAKQVLQELERFGPDSIEFPALFSRLRQSVLTHAEHEEREEFPTLRESLDATRSQGMAAAVKAAEAMAPTHPHAGVESAAQNILVGPFAAMMDRTRDVLRKASGSGG